MDEKDKDLEAASANPDLAVGVADVSRSPTGSSTDIDEKGHKITKNQQQYARVIDEKIDKGVAKKPARKRVVDNDDESAYTSDSVDHGEPDLEHEDIEDTVSGHELDRQLSRVGSPRHPHRTLSVSLTHYSHVDFAANSSLFPFSSHRPTMSKVCAGSNPAAASSPRSPGCCQPSQAVSTAVRTARASAAS